MGQFISETTLESCIEQTLAKLLGDSGQAQQLIQTLRGYGYRFIGAVEVQREEGAASTGTREPPTPRGLSWRRSLAQGQRPVPPAGSWGRSSRLAGAQPCIQTAARPAGRHGPWSARRRAAPAHHPLL